jgi:archaellum component FlaC
MVQLGRQDERLNGVDHRIEDLKTRVDKVERCEMRG